MLSIAGKTAEDTFSDSIVPLRSALSSRLIFDNIHTYIEKIEVGSDAAHQAIFESDETVKLVHWFLSEYRSPEEKVYQTAK